MKIIFIPILMFIISNSPSFKIMEKHEYKNMVSCKKELSKIIKEENANFGSCVELTKRTED